MAHEHDGPLAAAKVLDLIVDPFQCHHDILEAIVAGKLAISESRETYQSVERTEIRIMSPSSSSTHQVVRVDS